MNPKEDSPYIQNVLNEDQLIIDACNKIGLKTIKKAWDDDSFDWSSTKCVVFRTTWDYFHRFPEFSVWLKKASAVTRLINAASLIHWNIDKHYLAELEAKGVRIAPSKFIETGSNTTLMECFEAFGYDQVILKPCISGAARHTYKLSRNDIQDKEVLFQELIKEEAFILQEFQKNIMLKGEVSLIMFGGKFSHAILKKAKKGDFRVQDDWGGTIEDYTPTEEEILFAEKAVLACPEMPIYARVDVMWNDNNEPVLAELELIEPELWFRRNTDAAGLLASAIKVELV
jgi:glutathione synthase/RimK-type ligase-like ATP-grasp enzyme